MQSNKFPLAVKFHFVNTNVCVYILILTILFLSRENESHISWTDNVKVDLYDCMCTIQRFSISWLFGENR